MIYIGYYALYNSKIKRLYTVSAVNKIKYILKSLGKTYREVDVFSVSPNIESDYRIFHSETIKEGNTKIHHPISWGGKGKIHLYVMYLWMKICLFFYLLFKANKGEHIYVYHSTGYGRSILLAKALKKFKLILEVEEIYSDVQKGNKNLRNKENRYFKAADAFIFSTSLLNGNINKKAKPFIVINGTYEVEKPVSTKFADGKIHIVYAGTFDIRKGGGVTAVAVASKLDKNYVVHICGFGEKTDEEALKELIQKSNKENSCKVFFHGLLKGDEYISFLQSCHIGLSTQNPGAVFNATSFPSKILSYLANGLSVVSIRIPAIVQSEVGDYITYYEEQTPEAIANAIKNAPINEDFRDVVFRLSNKFDRKLIELKNSI